MRKRFCTLKCSLNTNLSPSTVFPRVFFLLSFVIISFIASAQNKTITGFVKNEKGEPIPSVSVVVKETTVGTTTDPQGKFSIQVPPGKNVLVFSIVGYTPKEVSLDGQTSLNVQLESSNAQLGDVVVVAYGTTQK